MESGEHEFKKEKPLEKSLADKIFPENVKSMPKKIKQEYKDFISKVKEVNSGISEKEAANKVLGVENKYDYEFFGKRYQTEYKNEAALELILSKRKFSAMEELHLLGEEDKKQLDMIKNNFTKAISEVSELTGESPEFCNYYLDKILFSGLVENLEEAKNVLVNGPKIKGFEETQDVKISNKRVGEFLKNSFGKDVLRKSMIALIDKDDRFLIKCDNEEKSKELRSRFNLDYLEFTNLRVASNKEDYIKAEMFLEGVDDESKLKHLYKVRATAGIKSGFAKIDLHSVGVEKSGDFDYLFDYLKEDKLLTSEDEKMRAYILGTVGHEVAHKIEPKGQEYEEYVKIVEEEINGDKKFVSDYVRRHKDLYESNQDRVLKEDFTESVR